MLDFAKYTKTLKKYQVTLFRKFLSMISIVQVKQWWSLELCLSDLLFHLVAVLKIKIALFTRETYIFASSTSLYRGHSYVFSPSNLW